MKDTTKKIANCFSIKPKLIMFLYLVTFFLQLIKPIIESIAIVQE